MKLLITGSRAFEDYETIERHISDLDPGDIVIQGGCRGADALAERACERLGIHCAEIKPIWKNGKSAGPARNQAMLDLEPDLVLAFPLPGSKGTWDCVNEAKRRGIPVEVVTVEVHDGR